MAYKKTTWATGDVITADKMNNIEEGIASVTGADSPNTKDIRDYLDTSMSQKGQKHITLRPDDFSELYADGKVLTPGSDASIAVETTNSAWKIYKYELGRAFVLRADQIVKNNSAAGCVPIAFRYKGVDYSVDYDRLGGYYIADTVLVSYNAMNEAYAIEEFSFTETVRQEFSDSIICRDHAGEFDSLVVFGDSIFANTISNPDTGALTNNGNGVTKQLADLMGIPLYKHAVNNATLSTKYTGEAQNVVKQIQDYIASPDGGSRPLFIIEGGTNDAYHYGVSNLGTYGSSDTTTIYGAIYYAINLLLSIEGVQPWQILVCTPIPKGIRALWDGTTSFSSAGWLANTDLELTTIGHAMYEIALNRQCSVINGYNAIFDELSSQYICQLMMGDDTHPTVYGSERYARYIYDTLFSGASTKEVEEDIASLKSAFAVSNPVDVDWERGSINANGGANINSTTRIRTSGYIIKPFEIVSIDVPDGMKVSIRYYNQPSVAGFDSSTDWMTGTVTLGADKPAYARIVAAYTGEGTIDASAGIGISITKTALIDANIKMIDKAADAKAVQIRTDGLFNSLSGLLDNEQITPIWQNGNISATSGAGYYATNRVRTSAYLFTKNGMRIVLPTGIMANVCYYASEESSGFAGMLFGNMQTGTILVPPYTTYVRIIAAKTDNSAIKVQEMSAAEVYRYVLSQELTESGKAADAKIIGDLIAEIKGNVDEQIAALNDSIANTDASIGKINGTIYITPNASLNWVQGTIATNNGQDSTIVTNRLRSIYVQYVRPFIINMGDDMKYSYRTYKRDGTFITSSSWIETSGELSLGNDVGNVRFVCAYKTDADILPNDDFVFDVQFPQNKVGYSITDNSTATGNVSIRAAKTIMCSDGTPPIIDWYLVQTVNNQFYRSKDLQSKEYLFTFTPPSGIVSNWSAGITATNDIIFVADAAGLSDAEGRLNDANRINPMCFLASENYSTMHIIDFGSSKKPCGWLENVGYCVLPNGDTLFCEYTRGVVKTANVWRISGDVSNPSNWTITWTHDIIDTNDTTTEGIKHCHEMQYDFYTGIVYFGTGDSPTGSYNYYSTDNGATWQLLYGPDKNRCRRLTYVFTADKVYWASDSYDAANHHFFIADRDSNGLVDIENAQEIALTSNNDQACYGCVYLKSLNAVVMMDRVDGSGSDHFDWYCYDIDSATVKKIGSFNAAPGTNVMYPGFRCKFVDWYPVDNVIHTGFNPVPASVQPDSNQNALCGNLVGRAYNGAGRVNNLAMYVYKNVTNYSYRASTVIV